MDTLERLVVLIKEHHPDFEIRFKDESLPYWLRPIFWFQGLITKGFWTRYTTTVGGHVYFPSRAFYDADKARAFVTLAHEFVHIYDAAQHGRIIFALRYLFPQVTLGLLGLLGILGVVYAPLYALFGLLLFLAPWPAHWRVKAEKRGYQMTILVRTMMGQPINEDQLVDQFVSRPYYWMSRDKKEMTKWVHDEVLCARANLANIAVFDQPYRDVYNVYYAFQRKK